MSKSTASTDAQTFRASQAAVDAKLQRKPRTEAASESQAIKDLQPAATPKGKLGLVVSLLVRPEGATIEALSEATGWQFHSVRGAISGSLKKKLGMTVTSEKVSGDRVYRIQKGAGA